MGALLAAGVWLWWHHTGRVERAIHLLEAPLAKLGGEPAVVFRPDALDKVTRALEGPQEQAFQGDHQLAAATTRALLESPGSLRRQIGWMLVPKWLPADEALATHALRDLDDEWTAPTALWGLARLAELPPGLDPAALEARLEAVFGMPAAGAPFHADAARLLVLQAEAPRQPSEDPSAARGRRRQVCRLLQAVGLRGALTLPETGWATRAPAEVLELASPYELLLRDDDANVAAGADLVLCAALAAVGQHHEVRSLPDPGQGAVVKGHALRLDRVRVRELRLLLHEERRAWGVAPPSER
jgi:hypothetical protein